MKVLLDTHAFIWWDSDPVKLFPAARNACEDPTNVVILSVVSALEMEIKLQLGKLHLRLPLTDIIADHRQTNGIHVMSIDLAHVLALQDLPFHHKDPFDRLLVAQSLAEPMMLLTNDGILVGYGPLVQLV